MRALTAVRVLVKLFGMIVVLGAVLWAGGQVPHERPTRAAHAAAPAPAVADLALWPAPAHKPPHLPPFFTGVAVPIGPSVVVVNYGPAEPARADLTMEYSVSEGCSISPEGPVLLEGLLVAIGDQVYPEAASWTLICNQPGEHTLRFGATVVLDPEDAVDDPSSENNHVSFSWPVPFEEREGHVLGDVDCDSDMTVIDALHILRYVAVLRSYSPCIGVGDLNCDGSTDAVDALGVLRVVANLSALPRPSFCSDLSAAIAQETLSQASSGWDVACPGWYHELSDAVGSFDNTNHHRVAVYCHETTPYMEKVVIYELQGHQLVPLLTFDQPIGDFDTIHFDLVSPEDGRLPVLRDIQGDGMKELVVRQYTGGNCWECSRLRLFAVQDHSASEIPVMLPPTGLLGTDHDGDGTSAVPVRLSDIDGDGLMEVIALDAAWELHGFCHACSPGGWLVLAWNGERYTDASRDPRFRSWFDARISEIEALLAQGSDEYLMSDAISIALLYGHSGRADQGWQRFHEIVAGLQTDCWKNAAPLFQQDLELSVPKNGEAPSTSVHGSPALTWPTCLVMPPW